MPFAFVQAASNGTDATSATTIAVTVSAVGAGNMIAGIVCWGSGTTSNLTSITDNGTGNTYTIVRRIADATNGECAASFYGYNLSGAPTVITANFSTALSYRGISVEEFSGGLTSADPLDGTNEAGQLEATPGTGANGANSGTSKTPSADNYLVWGGSVNSGDLSNGGSEFAAGTNFTEPANAEYSVGGAISISSEYEIQTTAAARDASFTVTKNTAHITFMMIFKVNVGIAFDAASNSGYQTAQSTYSWSHTCTGANRYLVVGVSMLSVAGSSVSGITYNSVALTKLGHVASVSGAVRAELWGLVAPATGSHTVAVTLSASLDSEANAVSLTGIHQTLSIEGFNTATATNVGAADATVNVTTVANNDLVIDQVASDDTAITVGAGQTSRNNVTGALGSGADSTEGPKTPAGSVTMSWTNVAALATWSIAAVALRPTSASGPSSSGGGGIKSTRGIRRGMNRGMNP